MASGGRAAQQEAMDNPDAYDDESAELLGWFDMEVNARGRVSQIQKAVA